MHGRGTRTKTRAAKVAKQPKFIDIGERLRVTREAEGLLQNEFADRAGLAYNTYNQYEQGWTRPKIENAIRLCETYKLTLDWIYRGDPSGLRYKLAEAIKSIRQLRAPETGPSPRRRR